MPKMYPRALCSPIPFAGLSHLVRPSFNGPSQSQSALGNSEDGLVSAVESSIRERVCP